MPSRSYRIGRSLTGLGLFAAKQIKRGAYIATYRGRRIPTEESDRREARGARYMFELNKRWVMKLIARSTRHKGFGFDSTQHEWTVKLYYEIEQTSE